MKNIVKKSDIEEIEMDLTGTCNLRCYICTRNFVHSQHMVKKNIRPMSEIIKQIDSFSGLKRFFIAGTISEPTLHPEFFEFIEHLNKKDITYEIYTNASCHSNDWWEQLGKLVPEKCKTIFTVCGSTQELHEKYRVGSKLEDVLEHAEHYRLNNRHNDYVQHILFEYNKEDYYNGNMTGILKQFSHSFQVHSEGRRLDDRKVVEQTADIIPPKDINAKINYIFSKRPPLKSNICIRCKLERWKKIYIDQYGNMFPCYTYAENGYPKLPDASEFDLTTILEYNYPDCFLCSKDTERLIETFKLDFVC